VRGDDDVHPRCWSALTGDEQDEALDFRHRADRVRFVVARALLRRSLAAQWSLAPRVVAIDRDPEGRVVVTPPAARGPLFASVSHAGDWVAVAAAPVPVGIDVEAHAAVAADSALIAKVCSRREQRILRLLPSVPRGRYFTRLWTRKEAVVKATGHRRPELIDVSRPRVRGVASTTRWEVHDDRACGAGYELAWAAPTPVRLDVDVVSSP